jgi:hypothetical protein
MTSFTFEKLDAPSFLQACSLSTKDSVKDLAKYINSLSAPSKIFPNLTLNKKDLLNMVREYINNTKNREDIIDSFEKNFRKHKNDELITFINSLNHPEIESPKVNKRSNKDDLWTAFRKFAVHVLGKEVPKPEKKVEKKVYDKNGATNLKRKADDSVASENKKIKLDPNSSNTAEELQKKVTILEMEKNALNNQYQKLLSDYTHSLVEVGKLKLELQQQLNEKITRENDLKLDFSTLDATITLLMQNYREMDQYMRGMGSKPSLNEINKKQQQILNKKVALKDETLRAIIDNHFR